MRKITITFLQFLLFFAVFSVFVNAIYLLVIIKTDWDFRKRIESLRFSSPDYDALILGSSLAQYGIDSELMTKHGLKSYNMALVGNSVKTCYIQLQEYLEKYSQKPEYVILVANSCLESFDQEGIHPVVEFTMKKQKIDFTDIPVSKFRWQGTELFKKALSKEYRSGYLSFGQLRRSKIVEDYSEHDYLHMNYHKYEKAIWIEKIAASCAEEQIKLVLIEIPGVNETQNSDSIGPYIVSFKNKNDAILYNFNSIEFCRFIEPTLDWIGLSHFNEKGAAKFTEKMLEFMDFKLN